MELTGDEKRIRALFSELSLEDQANATRFATLWSRAENCARTGTAQPPHFKSFAVVAIALTVVAFVVAGVLTAWSWSNPTIKSPAHNAVNLVPQIAPSLATPPIRESNKAVAATDRPRSHPRHTKSIARQQTTERTAVEAEMLARWQSPTNILMASPTGLGFSSLPQLNESAAELKQFLPKNNEAMKESNQ